MASIIQDLQLLGAVSPELSEFASGQATSVPPVKIGSSTYVIIAQKFGASQPPVQYQIISGGVLGILEAAFMIYPEFAAGLPISIGEKVGNDWYGVTVSRAPAPV